MSGQANGRTDGRTNGRKAQGDPPNTRKINLGKHKCFDKFNIKYKRGLFQISCIKLSSAPVLNLICTKNSRQSCKSETVKKKKEIKVIRDSKKQEIKIIRNSKKTKSNSSR